LFVAIEQDLAGKGKARVSAQQRRIRSGARRVSKSRLQIARLMRNDFCLKELGKKRDGQKGKN
jgi:hypothetical protein